MEQGSSIDKIADAQGSGFARVDDDLDVMRKDVNLVRVNASSLDTSMKSVLERLAYLEKQNTAKDKLISDLDCRIIQPSETLAQCSSGEVIRKTSSGSGSREDPFELEGMEDESWGVNPQRDSPEATKADSPTLGYKLEEGRLYAEEGVEEDKERDVIAEDSEEERRHGRSSSIDDVLLAMGDVQSSSRVNLLPRVREESEGPSYAGSGQRVVHSEGRPRRPSSFHPYRKAEPRRDGSSFSQLQRRSSLVSSEGSCHCDCDHSEIESDGSYTSFLTDRSVDLGPLSHS